MITGGRSVSCLGVMAAMGLADCGSGQDAADEKSGIKIEARQDVLAGYASVTNYPDDPEAREALCDVEQGTLRGDWPTCSDE